MLVNAGVSPLPRHKPESTWQSVRGTMSVAFRVISLHAYVPFPTSKKITLTESPYRAMYSQELL